MENREKLDLDKLLSKCNKILPDEAKLLVGCVIESQAKTILEIGGGFECSASGVCLAFAARETGGHVYSIDPRHSDKWDEFVASFGVSDYITKIVGESPWCHRHEALKDIKDIDVLFIDGDHTPTSVVTDFVYWSRFVTRSGIILFHDYNESETGKGVKRAIRFIRDYTDLVELARVNVEGIKGLVAFGRK